MQLHTPADGQPHEMSIVSYPSPTCADPSSCVDARDKYNHWWPSQAYHCTFCPRVFRTAQALGGHMNIHRRERAFANDMGTHFHTRRDTPTHCSTTILSRSSSLPGSLASERASLFGASHHLLMNHAPPPASENSMPPSSSSMQNCYANRRIAVSKPPAAPDYNVSTHHLVTANFAPFPADMTYRVAWNEESSHHAHGHHFGNHLGNNTISDPLSWLFSQLPAPGSATNLQRQQQLQSRGSTGSSNIQTQKNVTKPYHRALAVRRSGGRPSPLSVESPQSRGGSEAAGSVTGNGEPGDGEESLDLELRL